MRGYHAQLRRGVLTQSRFDALTANLRAPSHCSEPDTFARSFTLLTTDTRRSERAYSEQLTTLYESRGCTVLQSAQLDAAASELPPQDRTEPDLYAYPCAILIADFDELDPAPGVQAGRDREWKDAYVGCRGLVKSVCKGFIHKLRSSVGMVLV